MKFGKPLRLEKQDVAKESARAAEEGFGFVQLAMRKTLQKLPTHADATNLRKTLEDHGIEAGLHAPFADVHLANPSAAVRKKSIEKIRKCLPFAAAFESKFIIIHVGTGVDNLDSETIRAGLEHGAESVAELAETAGESGLLLCVENKIRPTFSTLEDLLGLGSIRGVSFCLDTGHVFRSHFEGHGKPPGAAVYGAWLRGLGKKLAVCHIHDVKMVDGELKDHFPLGDGIFDYKRFIGQLAETPCEYALLEVEKCREMPDGNQRMVESLGLAKAALDAR